MTVRLGRAGAGSLAGAASLLCGRSAASAPEAAADASTKAQSSRAIATLPAPVPPSTARPMPESASSARPRSVGRARGPDGQPALRWTAVGKLLPLLGPPLHRPRPPAGAPAPGGFRASPAPAWRRGPTVPRPVVSPRAPRAPRRAPIDLRLTPGRVGRLGPAVPAPRRRAPV